MRSTVPRMRFNNTGSCFCRRLLSFSSWLTPVHLFLSGKEAIATVGVRIGRTAAHVTLYLCSAVLGGAPPQRVLMGVALLTAVLWAVTLKRVEVLTREGGGSPRHAGRIDIGGVATGRLSKLEGRGKARRRAGPRVEINGAGAAAAPVATAANSHRKGSKEL